MVHGFGYFPAHLAGPRSSGIPLIQMFNGKTAINQMQSKAMEQNKLSPYMDT